MNFTGRICFDFCTKKKYSKPKQPVGIYHDLDLNNMSK